jgi:PspC domain.
MYYSRGSKAVYREKWMRVPHSVLFGVCEGLARRLDVPVALVRILALILFVSTGFFPTGLIYLALGVLLPVGPSVY